MIRRALLFWCFMAVVMIANGIVRETLLRPRMSKFAAELLSAVIGITLIQLLARRAMRCVGRAKRDLILVSSIWLLLTLAFEFTFGHWVDHKSWAELFANYNIANGHLWPFVLASLVCAPFVWGRSNRPATSVTVDPVGSVGE